MQCVVHRKLCICLWKLGTKLAWTYTNDLVVVFSMCAAILFIAPWRAFVLYFYEIGPLGMHSSDLPSCFQGQSVVLGCDIPQ